MVRIKNMIGLLLVVSFTLLLLVSCGTEEEPGFIAGFFNQENTASIDINVADVEANTSEVVDDELVEAVEIEANACEFSDECEWNEHCIEGKCGTVSDIYDLSGECESTCNFNNVLISTSDGEEMTLSRGKGSYTSAGALEWKLLSSADYCLRDEPTPVAVELIKKNLGKVVGKEVIVLEVGEESGTIKHPDLASVSFQMTVESYDETCSVN